MAPGRKFCTSCGSALSATAGDNPTPVVASERTARPAGSGERIQALSARQWAVVGGFIVAAVGTFLDWVSSAGIGVSGWDGDARFRIADWLGVTAPIDAIIVLAVALGGAFLVAAPLFGQAATPSLVATILRLRYATVMLGVLIVVLAALQIYRIADEPGLDLGNVGIGVWAIILGGGAAAFFSYLEEEHRG